MKKTMMRRFWNRRYFLKGFCLAVLLFGVSCSRAQRLEPLPSGLVPESEARCAAPFVTENWQFIHSIEASLGGEGAASVIGVTNVYPERRAAHCVMMTVEGFVLFDATFDQQLHVKRGVPPFESKAFAEGLMRDIALIFFKPFGKPTGSALSKAGSLTCRYERGDETVEDVCVNADDSWMIHQYRKGSLHRFIRTGTDRATGTKNGPFIPKELELTACGDHGYSLHLRLIDAKRLKEAE